MTRLLRGAGHVLTVLVRACLAGAYLFVLGIFVAVVMNVVLRSLGLDAVPAAVPFVEYGMLYIPLLAMPHLVRTRGHVFVELGISVIPRGRPFRIYESVIYLICAGICLVVVVVSADLFALAWSAGYKDLRAVDVPEWLLYLPFVVGFTLSAGEFLRYFLGKGTYYVSALERESL